MLGTALATDDCSAPVVTSNAPFPIPVGIRWVTWTAADACGNIATCTQKVTILDNNQPPDITCPGPVVQTALPNNCALNDVTIPDPVSADNCRVVLQTWTMSGKTTGSSPAAGINSVSGQTFNVGHTTVTYSVADSAGNSSSCSFDVWIKDLVKPVFTIGCPADMIQVADADACGAFVTVPDPAVSDPCGEIVSVMNDYNNTPHASGYYPVGVTTVRWTLTDESGNTNTCDQTITVTDNQPPVLTCPAPVTVTATAPECVFPEVVIDPLVATDNCGIASITWSTTGATSASGSSDVSRTTSFNVGVTTVTYLATDLHGNTSDCSFEVTVRDQVPPLVITCPADITQNVDANSCSAVLNIPDPVVIDPCGEIVSVVNSFNNTANASGVYPAGVTNVTWTFTDESGNSSTCAQTITIIDNIQPTITCPGDMEQILLSDGCLLSEVAIPDPIFTDNCAVKLTWVMTGATTGSSPATGINFAGGQAFHVGITQVTYTVADAYGNSVSCSFNVWIKDLVKPEFSVGCPGNIMQDADPGMCNAFVNVPVPDVYDPCNELVSIVNSFNGTDNASGVFPIGITLVTWTITDLSGNVNTCEQEIKINDLFPTLACPPDIIANADFNLPYASGVATGTPVYSDNCPGFTLTWVSSDPTPGISPPDGININTVSTFNTGVTTIIYTLTDTHNHSVTCSFSITVLSKVVITCPADTFRNNDPGLCTATFNPGSPVKVSGVDPVTWEWVMTGATNASGTGNPLTPNPYTFNTGTTSITWTATNVSGTDTCDQLITVIDDQQPTFDASPKSFCVENILQADFDPSAMDIEPYQPDFFTFKSGNTSLDITGIHDNCCSPPNISIHWRIDFTPTPDPSPPHDPVNTASVSGEGQPSGFGDIQLPGDGVTFLDVIHRITYWLTDCHGNNSIEKSADITIKPRPQIIKN